jgi:hypothetical protein
MRGFVTPKYINPASDRGGASLKDEAGIYWYLPDDMQVDQFQPNTTYDVVYSQATSKASGKTYHKIVELLASNVPQEGATAPPAASAPQSAPAAPQGVRGPTQTPVVDKTPLRIFCCGVVQNAMASGDFTPDHIDPLTAAAKKAFEKYLA